MSLTLPSPEAATEMLGQTIPFVARMGLRVELVELGHVRLSAPLAPNVNHFGTMYAGALVTIAEIPGGILTLTLCDPRRYFPVLTGMDVRFVRTATTDVTVDAWLDPERAAELAAEADRAGRARFELAVEVKDAHGTVAMTSRADYQLRTRGGAGALGTSGTHGSA